MERDNAIVTVAITLDRYSHLAMAMHQEAADALEGVLRQSVSIRVGSPVGSPPGDSST